MNRSFNRTWTFVKRLADYVSFGKIAQTCGKETGTAEAWGREPASNANPFGTGKANTFDCSLRLVALAHKEDAGLAREIAEMFKEFVDHLEGVETETRKGTVNELVGVSIKEHAEAVVILLNGDKPDFAKAHTEIAQAKVALDRLDRYVLGEMREQTEHAFAANGNGKR
jgi:hypothetical protein